MKNKSILLAGLFLLSAILFSCQKQTAYPCPGLGQSSESDFSQFTDDGQLKDSKDSKSKKKKGNGRRINHENGMVNKKTPKEIHAPRKTKL